MFLTCNKTIYTCPALPDEFLERNTAFKDVAIKDFEQESMSFKEAWPELKTRKCIMYFDNTWMKEDYLSIMSEGAVGAMLSMLITFGLIFMNNNKKRYMTRAAHASPLESIFT